MVEALLYATVAPLVLSLFTPFWRYPASLEELVKWWILRTMGVQVNWRLGLIVGATFGLSETVLYSLNAWSGGEWGPLVSRLLLTVPMHALTGSVTAWGMSRGWGWLGVIVAMILHALFNRVVTMP